MQDVPDTTAELKDNQKYKKIKELNKGAHGVVVLAESLESGEKVAIKLIKRGPEMRSKYALREILNHRSLIHPHIVQFKEVFLTENCLAIVMEYCSGGDMLEYVVKRNGLPEASSRWFFQQLVSAVDYLHKMGFASRDIKLDNVLLDKSRRPLLKLCDFGYSKHIADSAAGSIVGTPAYLAPEVIRADDAMPYNPQLADIWCCGVFLYASTIGTYPFYRPQDRGNPKEVQIMIKRILRMEYKIPESGKVSNELRDLLSKILMEDPQQRISIQDIMKHPWFLKDLPQGVLEMNEELPEPGDDVQPLSEVEKVMRMASVPTKSLLETLSSGSPTKRAPGMTEANRLQLSAIPESANTSTSSERSIERSIGLSPKTPNESGSRQHAGNQAGVSPQPTPGFPPPRQGRRSAGDETSPKPRIFPDKPPRPDPTVAAMRRHLLSVDREEDDVGGRFSSAGNPTSPTTVEKSCLPCIRWNK